MASLANCNATAAQRGTLQQYCITNNLKGSGTGCKTDTCTQISTAGSCADTPGCAFLPAAPSGRCMNAQLLCWSLLESSCVSHRFCKWIGPNATYPTPFCMFTVPNVSPVVAAQVANTCPALHPAVVAIIVVMFVSLVAAVVVVIVVVCLNKRRQDEIDKEEEEAAAAAADQF